MNDAYSAGEARWLEEPDRDWGFCDVLGCQHDAEPESILCAAHEDQVYDYRNGDSND